MKEFDVYVQNRPGELAKVCERLGNQGVNIRAISSERGSVKPMIRIVTDDESTTKTALGNSGVSYDTKDVIAVRMQDRPGELGKIARKLARAMVNVESIYILAKEVGVVEIVMTVDDIRNAESAMK